MRYIVIPDPASIVTADLYERFESTENNPRDPLAPRYFKVASGIIDRILNIAKQLNEHDQAPTGQTVAAPKPEPVGSTGPHVHFPAEPTPPADQGSEPEPAEAAEQRDKPEWRRQGSGEIDEKVAELKDKPGEWERIKQISSSAAGNSWKRRGCEARMATEDGEKWLYVRWPEAETPQPSPVAPPPAPAAPPAPAPRPRTVAEVPAKALKPPAPAKPSPPKPLKATLPLTTKRATEAPRLDPNDPDDAYLLRLRQRQEADRAARLAGNKPSHI